MPPRKGEGTRAQLGENRVQHAVDRRHDLPVREADDLKALTIEIACSALIANCTGFISMLISINLDDQLRWETAEVRYVWADRNLTSKMTDGERETLAQMPPEFLFWLSQVSA
jgi:hypothetical protein